MLQTVSNVANAASIVAIAAATVTTEYTLRLGYRLRLIDYVVDVIFAEED